MMPIDENTQVLTVNNHLARELQQQYDQQQAASGQRVWRAPNILPWSAWLQRQYETLTDIGFNQRILLNAHQEKALWEQIVSRHYPALFNPKSAAKTAQQAWQLMHAWLLPQSRIEQYANEETQCFLNWQKKFRRYCRKNHFITQAELIDLCLAGLQAGQLNLDEPIQLMGFDDINPQQQALLDQLDVSIPEQPQQTAETCHIAFDNLEDEMHAAACWARHQLTQTTHQHIAIISPDLHRQKSKLLPVLREIINPHTLLPGATDRLDFNVSLGQPLADYPLIAQLLLALQLAEPNPIPLQDISVILGSPFIGGHREEWSKRATLDFKLHDEGAPQLTPANLLEKAQAHEAADLADRLATLNAWVVQLPRQASPEDWSGYLLQIFGMLGWPGEQSLNSHEYQQAERLRRLINEFASLSLVKPKMSLAEAVNKLRQLCEESLFQPKAPGGRLSVLGILEAAGMPFDSLWLLGMDHQQWPPPAAPNPLLPIQLQREEGMPHASSARELRYAERLTQGLCHASRQIIASYARRHDDQEHSPSPLIRAWPEIQYAALNINADSPLRQAARQTGTTEPLPAPEAVPPQPSPSGGSHLLNAQSICPFQAVARFRLQAQPLPTTQTAPDGRLNGQILHQLLQTVWLNIQDSHQLRRLDQAALKHLIKSAATSVLNDFNHHRPDVFTPPFIRLEIDRLTRLVADWLTLEKERIQPFRINQLEKRQLMTLNQLPLRLQADRIDELEDGSLVIIDYKSGVTANPDWLDERPSDLQVPLYCIQTEKPAAALIAQVNDKRNRFFGITSDQEIAPGARLPDAEAPDEQWQTLLVRWRHILEALAMEIRQGRADIAPKNDQACARCGMQALCRIQVQSQ